MLAAQEQETGTAEAADAAAGWQQPDYAVPLLDLTCMGQPCGSIQITDLFVSSVDDDGAGTQQGGFRLRLRDLAYLGLAWGDERKAATLRTSRSDLVYEDTDGRRVALDARAARLRLEVEARERAVTAGGGWQLRATTSLRLGPDLEVQLGGERDLQSVPQRFQPPRARTLGRIGVLWQRGTNFELRAGLRAARFRDGLGDAFNLWGVDAAATLLLDPVELQAQIDYSKASGRFGRREVTSTLGAKARLGSHLLAEIRANEQVELGVSENRRGGSIGLSWFARRYRFERGSEASAAVLALTRQAWQQGYNERRVYDTDGMRELRERLSLAGLTEPVEQLYRATVDSRNVPVVSVEVGQESRFDEALRRRTLRGSVGMPWPLNAPWGTDEESVRFLRVSFLYEQDRLRSGLEETGWGIGLDVLLNRELAAHFSWRNPVRSPLEIAFGNEGRDVVALSLDYAFWR